MRRPRQRRRCSRVERPGPCVLALESWSLGGARDRAAHYSCLPLAAPGRTELALHNAVRAPGSDSVVMHVAGQFDPPGDPHRFTGRHMLRSHIPFEQQPPAFMPRPRSLRLLASPGHSSRNDHDEVHTHLLYKPPKPRTRILLLIPSFPVPLPLPA
jgi:hypothetical protein